MAPCRLGLLRTTTQCGDERLFILLLDLCRSGIDNDADTGRIDSIQWDLREGKP
jgi:hypothetical protein